MGRPKTASRKMHGSWIVEANPGAMRSWSGDNRKRVVSVIAVLLPGESALAEPSSAISIWTAAAFHLAIASSSSDSSKPTGAIDPDQGEDILRISRGVAVILLISK